MKHKPYQNIFDKLTIIIVNLSLKHHFYFILANFLFTTPILVSSFVSPFYLTIIFTYYYYFLSPLYQIFFFPSSPTFFLPQPSQSCSSIKTNPMKNKTKKYHKNQTRLQHKSNHSQIHKSNHSQTHRSLPLNKTQNRSPHAITNIKPPLLHHNPTTNL